MKRHPSTSTGDLATREPWWKCRSSKNGWWRTKPSCLRSASGLRLRNVRRKQSCKSELQAAADKAAAAELKSEALAQDLLKLEKSLGAMAQRQRKEQEDALASEDAITEAKTLFLEQKTNLMAQVAEQEMVLQDCQAKLKSAQTDAARTKEQAKDHSSAMQSRVDEAVDARAAVQRKLGATQQSLLLGTEIEQLHAD